MIERLAYAKINLFLDVEGIRADGYHDILSVMQTVSWSDRIYLEKLQTAEILLSCTDASIPTDQTNTAYRAAELFISRLAVPMGVRIHIEKHIPSSAGLAGGSADAAAVLLGLNEITGNAFSQEALLQMGAKIGADVPFCMIGGTQITKGIGDVIEPFPAMPFCYLVCAKLGEGISTPEAYGAIDKQNDFFKAPSVKHDRLAFLKKGFEKGDLNCLSEGTFNIFERAMEEVRPGISILKRALINAGAKVAMMSGSGPSVFGVFEDKMQAEQACEAVQNMGAICAICTPIPAYGGCE